MPDTVNIVPPGLKEVLESIDRAVQEQKGDQYFSIQDIAKKGWIGGAKYASVKRLIESRKIKSIALEFPNRPPVKKVHAEDLKVYIQQAYQS